MERFDQEQFGERGRRIERRRRPAVARFAALAMVISSVLAIAMKTMPA